MMMERKSVHRALRALLVALCVLVLLAVAAIMPPMGKPLIAQGVPLQDESIAGGARWYIVQAGIHFDNPFERILTLNRTVTGRRAGWYVVTSWTFFGMPLERAFVGDDGSVQTL